MLASNHTISTRQLKRLFIMEVFGASAILIPSIATRAAGKDGILAVVCSMAAILLYSCLLLKVTGSCFFKGYWQEIKEGLGGFGLWFFLILYFVRFFIRGYVVLKMFTEMIGESLLPNQSAGWIAVPVLFVAGYGAMLDLEGRGRFIELLFWWMFVPIGIVFLLSLGKVDYQMWLPDFQTESFHILKGGYEIMLTYLPLEFLLFLVPEVKEGNPVKHGMTGVLTVLILNLVLYIVTVGLLGIKGTQKSLLSTLNIMQLVEIPGGVLERFDLFMIVFWLIGLFTLLSGYVFYTTEILKKGMPNGRRILLVSGVVLALLLLSLLPVSFDSLYQWYVKYGMWVDFPLSMLCPLFILGVKALKKGGKKKEGIA